METVLFDHFVNNAPAPADVGLLEVPANVSSCAVALKKRGLVGGTNKIAGRSLVGWDNCNFVTAMTITLHYHYIKSTYDATRPKDLATRIKGSVCFCRRLHLHTITKLTRVGRLSEHSVRTAGLHFQVGHYRVLATRPVGLQQ
jgi:hypothetical protein